MSQEQQDAGRGVNIASRAMIAKSQGDDVLAVLNEVTSTGEAVWAAAQMLECLWEATLIACGRDQRKAARTLRAAAEGIHEDAVLTQVALIVADVERGL